MSEKLPVPCEYCKATGLFQGSECEQLEKIRHGDRDVEISVRNLADLSGRTPVLVDDIISSGRTMIEAVRQLTSLGGMAPVCVAVHGLFADNSDVLLGKAGARVITSNTVAHASNGIDVGALLENAIGGVAQGI